MILVGSTDTLFRSTDQGATWDTLPGASGTWAMAMGLSNANRIYMAGAEDHGYHPDGKVFRSDNLGSTWDTISSNSGFPADYVKITDIGVHPSNSSEVWITCGGFGSALQGKKVYRSLDAGANWHNMSGSIPDIPVNCVVIDTDGSAYVGTDLGVYFRSPSMNDWIPFSNDLPVVPVVDLFLYNSTIRAATYGRGVWESAKANTCLVSSSIGGTLTGDDYYEASFAITSTAQLYGGAGTWVVFKAGSYVNLTPGFEVPAGNTLKAQIGDCTEGGIPID